MNLLQFFSEVVDERTILEASAFAVGSSVSALLYFIHSRYESKSRKVKDAPALELDQNFAALVQEAPHSYLPYVAINGDVTTSVEPISCHANRNIRGVAWKKTTTEHKDVWARHSHIWLNETREVTSVSDAIPFELKGSQRDAPFVAVVDPLQSAWFDESIEVAHEEFVPAQTSTVESLVGFVSGDKLKGYTHTEKMLKLGTRLCAIGEVVFEDNMLKIRAPTAKLGPFVVSKLCQEEIVSQIKNKSTAWKVLAFLMGAASLTALYFIVRRLRSKYVALRERHRLEEEMAEIRNQRTRQAGRLNRDNAQNGNQERCVVCLANPRECVILDCGHICICVDCLDELPTPKVCPVCRSKVVKTVPLYNA